MLPVQRHRILVNAVHARAGGGITYLRNLLPLLAAEDDLQIHLIPHPSQADTFAALSPLIRIHRLRMPRRWLSLLLWEQFILPFLARRIGHDLVFSPANFGPILIPAQVVVIQNAVSAGATEHRLGKKFYWAALRLITVLSLLITRRAIAVSQYVADSSAASSQSPAPIVIHHGVDTMFSPASTVGSGDGFLLAVGDLYIQKNLHNLIEALSIVRRRHPKTVLRIAGGEVDTDYAARLKRLVVTRELGDAVIFLGRRHGSELVELYRGCAAFVFPSTIESFGMPLVEAMACGAPVIASATSAIPEIAGGAALLCNPQDPCDIAEKIVRVLDDAVLRQELRDRGRVRARAFSWHDCARRTAEVLRDAAAKKSPRATSIASSSSRRTCKL
jgi:glycosyltransferase involved in cell wall biosynthesis